MKEIPEVDISEQPLQEDITSLEGLSLSSCIDDQDTPQCMILIVRILDVDADSHEGADSESSENSLEISFKN